MSVNETTVPGSSRRPRLRHVRVEDAMHPGMISCPPDTSVRDVATILSAKHIHCLVVPDDGRPGSPADWGVISGLDLAAAVGTEVEERMAAEIAATEPVTVSSGEGLDRAAQLMVEHQVEHLIVVGAADGRPVGVLSTLDIAGAMAGDGA